MEIKRAPKARTQDLPLTPTDEEILKTISTYRYMTALDVSYSLFSPKSLTHVRSILSTLSGGRDYQDRTFLYRFPLPTAKAGNRERVYTLGAAGREVVESLGIPVDWYYRPGQTGRLSHSHLLHQLLLTRVVCAANYWCGQQTEYTLVDSRLCYELARNPLLANASESQGKTAASFAVIPDAWLLFERDGKKFPILLEIDRGTEYQERFKEHVRGRIEFIRSGTYTRLFETPAVIVAYTTTGELPEYRETRRNTMQRWTQEVLTEQKRENWASVFRFSSLVFEDIYINPLFEEQVWYRPGDPSPVPLLTS